MNSRSFNDADYVAISFIFIVGEGGYVIVGFLFVGRRKGTEGMDGGEGENIHVS